jgi:DNA phosphorothioation-dependent restriction protein DptG
MNDAGLAFNNLTTVIDVVNLHISAGSSQELIDAAVTQLEEAVVELTDCFPAKPLVPEPQLDLDDKAKMCVYRMLELLEEDAEDMVEKLQKVVSHLYKHVTGKWPHEVATEEEWRMWSSQGTHKESCKVNSCTY